MEDTLEPPDEPMPIEIMEELARVIKLLRAPVPALRRLRPAVAANWPIVTVLGTTKGGVHWMVIDVDRLMALEPKERAFLLGSGLGNLQCDHAPLFAAHLMAHRAGRGFGIVKALLRPWSRVAVFSADRAGLLSVAEFEPALAAMRAHGEARTSWMPPAPSMDLRERALRDFDRSTVMTRLRHSYGLAQDWSVAPPREQGEAQAAEEGNGKASEEPAEAASQPSEPPPPPTEPAGLEAELSTAWTLARCDALLTRRLGLF